MNSGEYARKILDVLVESNRPFLTLGSLAKASGFSGAYRKEFKSGFKLLLRKGIIKLNRSGWLSERPHHSPNVILLGNIYTTEDLEINIEGTSNKNPNKLFSFPKLKIDPLTTEQEQILTTFFSELLNSNYLQARKILSNFQTTVTNNYLQGFYMGLFGMVDSLQHRDERVFINQLDFKDKNKLQLLKNFFNGRMTNALSTDYDRGFMFSWYNFVEFLLKRG